jgi:hypothetical protein
MNNKGFITLISVLAISVIGGTIALGLILLGVNSTRSSLVYIQSAQARSLANACMEEALMRLRESIYYTGNETLSLTSGNCQIRTISGNGNTNRTITTTATVSNALRKVQVVVGTVNPTIAISSWQEVP